MAGTAKSAGWAVFLGVALAAMSTLLWLLQVAAATDLNSSDAAGNALAQGFTALEAIVLWLLLAILTVLALTKGDAPRPAAVAAPILVPVSGYCAIGALELLARPQYPPFLWPIVIPALVPPLIVAFGVWALVPALRARVPAWMTAGVPWGVTLVLCVALAPMQQVREDSLQREADQRATWAAELASLPPDAPLWRLTPFLESPDYTLRDKALARIVHLPSRQSDSETMLQHGDFPLRYLGRFDLDLTPALCDSARGLLRQRAQALMSQQPGAEPFSAITQDAIDAAVAMDWLVGHGCSCSAESVAWEATVKSYQGGDVEVAELTELRDPARLGRTLRENPEKFSMLTPEAHLKAWLGFADEEQFHDRALAGARTLAHRTSDAIEMLGGPDHLRWTALRYLPDLDLEPTPPLCEAARSELHRELAQIYRPGSDDPRPYRELLGRLGNGGQLASLQWLAVHGCAVGAQLREAESLVRAYQDSPERAAMLARLAALPRRS